MTQCAIVHIEGRDISRHVEVKGRDLWALGQLVEAGPNGCTPIGNPAEEIDVRRDGKLVFTRCLTVETWAGLTVSEDGDRDPRFRPYRGADAPHRGNSVLRVSHPPKDATPVSGPSVREEV